MVCAWRHLAHVKIISILGAIQLELGRFIAFYRFSILLISISNITSVYASSLSTIVLNSRDWYEIIWLPEISRFKNQPCNRFYPKKPAGMHW